MTLVFLDLETKRSFSAIEDRDPGKLGVSFVGIYKREKAKSEFGSFFEKDLPDLWPVLEKADQIIGFNILKFDFPALNPYYPGDLLKLPSLDLLRVAKNSLGRRIRLDNLAKATLVKSKIGSGWDAIEYFQKGELKKLEKYCLKDVEITRDLYDFGQENGFWRYIEPPNEVKEFTLKWPEVKKKAGVSLTLGI
jgi:DEAD/DEAH box helicase domain-containing protein